MFNRQNYNRGKFNVSTSLLAISGAASLALFGNVTGNLAFYAPLSLVNINMGVNGKQSALLNAPAVLAEFRLGVEGQSLIKLFSASPAARFATDMSGTMRCIVFAPDSFSDLCLGSRGHDLLRQFADAPKVKIALGLSGQGSRTIHAELSLAPLMLLLQGEELRRLSATAPFAQTNLYVKGSAEMFGYSTITLPGLVIPPGGDLVIDTEEMIVTLNGEDVTRFFGADSEFFKLKPGENIVIYEDGVQNRDISYKILWKDLWL